VIPWNDLNAVTLSEMSDWNRDRGLDFGWCKNRCDPISPPDFGHETGAMFLKEEQANLKEPRDFCREKKEFIL